MNGAQDEALAGIKSMTMAIERCAELAGFSPKVMADKLGVSYGHYVRMMRQGDAVNFPPDLIEKAMVECRNTLPLEWLAWRMGYRIHEQSLGDVLVSIHKALQLGGKTPQYAIHQNGRLERALEVASHG